MKLQTWGQSFIKKETLAQVFSCKFCKIFNNTFSNGAPPVAASEKINLQRTAHARL